MNDAHESLQVAEGYNMKKNSALVKELFQYMMLLLGMVNLLVLSVMSGVLGAGYLGISLAILVFLVSFHSLWLSSIVARYIRGRNARGQYKSSLKFFRGALLYAIVTGAAFCTLLILGANRLGGFFIRDIHIGLCLIPVALIFLVYGLSETVIGYLSGMNYHSLVRIFYLVRQVSAFVGSVAGMKFLSEYGQKVARLKHNEAVTSVYGAFGALLGILAGYLAGLIVVTVFCLLLRQEFYAMRGRDNARFQESTFHGFQVMLSLGIIQGFRDAILFAPLPLNYILYVRLCMRDGDSAAWIKTGGYLFGEAIPLTAALLLLYVILNHRNYRQLAGHWKSEAYAQFREKVFAMFLSVMTLALPVCLAVSVMAEPILKCLTKSTAKEGTAALIYMGIATVLLLFEIMAYRLMELWNETIYLYLTVLLSFGAQTVFAVFAFKTLDLGAAGIPLGAIVQAVLFNILFFVKFARRLRLSGNQFKKLVMALIVALAGVLIILLIYQLTGEKLSAAAAVAVSVIPGFLLYLTAVTLLRIVDDEEAELMPGGELFLWLNGLIRR